MHCMTAAKIKGVRGGGPLQDKPREGTPLRETYDLFQANRGIPISYTRDRHRSMQIPQLQDFYGLDIRNVGYGRWLLAGEWFGRVYVDYVAERLESQ